MQFRRKKQSTLEEQQGKTLPQLPLSAEAEMWWMLMKVSVCHLTVYRHMSRLQARWWNPKLTQLFFAKNWWYSPFWLSTSMLPILPWPKPCASPFLFPVVPQGLLDFMLMALWVISWWLLVVSYPGLLIWQMPLQQSISPCCRSLALSSIHLVMLPSSKQGLEKSVRDFQVAACDIAVISLILTLCSLCMSEMFKKMPLNLRPGAFRA